MLTLTVALITCRIGWTAVGVRMTTGPLPEARIAPTEGPPRGVGERPTFAAPQPLMKVWERPADDAAPVDRGRLRAWWRLTVA